MIGSEKLLDTYASGSVSLTNQRVLWRSSTAAMSLSLSLVAGYESQVAGLPAMVCLDGVCQKQHKDYFAFKVKERADQGPSIKPAF